MFDPDTDAPETPPLMRSMVAQMVTQLMERRAVTGSVDLADLVGYGWSPEILVAARPHVIRDVVAAIRDTVATPEAVDAAVIDMMAHEMAHAAAIAEQTSFAAGLDALEPHDFEGIVGAYGTNIWRLLGRVGDRARDLLPSLRRPAVAGAVVFLLPFLVGAAVEIHDRLFL